ncbi:MAG: PVC-type heme-binding CxxCH protein, partial [Isosphaeraceae bacterium]
MTRLVALIAPPLCLVSGLAFAGEVSIDGRTFQVPDGFSIEKVAGPPLVDRPIVADFDDRGRLYVADSSGSNEPVQRQLANPTHRIIRLEDADGDGRFDRRTVFADKVMFPEGTLWFEGSLYVSAPPSIWKFTDADGDGVAERREEWFQGKTLTGCANDLHGPYLGPDGWIYWAKGAFAQQTYDRPGKPPLVTKASHLFRARPDGGGIEPVMTGGMDNPVDVVFTPGGERVFTTTFLVHPGGGQRDGLIHAVYGGVYGKVHAVLDGHVRTGPDVMPVLDHLGPAAPCGLTRYEADAFGPGFRDNLFTACFNLQKVTRHALSPSGASFVSQTEDFVVGLDRDFHPTDVLDDSDGSLLIVDTGGWYKLCCPTTQLEKPDVLG